MTPLQQLTRVGGAASLPCKPRWQCTDRPTPALTARRGMCRCAVCRLEFCGEDEVRVLPCKHYYHPECASRWLVINKACPVCSKEVVPGRQP